MIFLSDQHKEIEENNRMGNTRDLLKKIRNTKGTFHAKMGTIKERNGMELTGTEDIERSGKNIQKSYTKKILMMPISMMVLSLPHSQTSWSAKSSRPEDTVIRTMLVVVMEFQLSYFKS